MINVGVAGLGFMGVTHLKAYRKMEGVRIAAICDAVRLPLDGDFSRIGGNVGDTNPLKLDMSQVRAYKNFEEMLANPEVALVDVCVPTPGHPQLATAALKAGKHVICEKPLARTAALAREIAAAAAQAKGFFMPAMCIRFWPEYAWLKQAVERQAYGRVLAAWFRRTSEPPGWSKDTYFDGKQSGGALLDLHIHDTDFVQFCFGRPKSVFSSGFSLFSGAIDYLVTHYRVAGGATIHAEGGWIMNEGFGFNMAYRVNFENATVSYDLSRGADALRVFEKGRPPQTIQVPAGDGYDGELRHMIQSIQANKPPSVVTAQDGVSAVEICEAEEKSIRTGRVVKL
jgi:predicted dehydrogenase